MQLGTAEDVRAVRDLLGDDALRDALRSAPPGTLDARSWDFWHLVLLGRPPAFAVVAAIPMTLRPRLEALPAPWLAIQRRPMTGLRAAS
jgi:hypothetical protein